MESVARVLGVSIVVVLFVSAWLTPWIVAAVRRHTKRAPLFVLNLALAVCLMLPGDRAGVIPYLGWVVLGLGWAGLLAWAIGGQRAAASKT